MLLHQNKSPQSKFRQNARILILRYISAIKVHKEKKNIPQDKVSLILLYNIQGGQAKLVRKMLNNSGTRFILVNKPEGYLFAVDVGNCHLSRLCSDLLNCEIRVEALVEWQQ